MTGIKPGMRWRSRSCTTEVVVVKAPSGGEVMLGCGGRPMVPHDDRSPQEGPPLSGTDAGTQLGKRYVDDARGLEVLCTREGVGTLCADDKVLVVKEAKPLPSSD